MERTSETKPVTIVAIGAGSPYQQIPRIRDPESRPAETGRRSGAQRHPPPRSRLQIRTEARRVLRRLRTLFRKPGPGRRHPDRNARRTCTSEPCMKAIEAGYNVLLEKTDRAVAARNAAASPKRRGAKGHRRRLPRPAIPSLFHQDQEIVDSGQLGEIISISHLAAVGLDRTTRIRPRHVAPRGDPPTRC